MRPFFNRQIYLGPNRGGILMPSSRLAFIAASGEPYTARSRTHMRHLYSHASENAEKKWIWEVLLSPKDFSRQIEDSCGELLAASWSWKTKSFPPSPPRMPPREGKQCTRREFPSHLNPNRLNESVTLGYRGARASRLNQFDEITKRVRGPIKLKAQNPLFHNIQGDKNETRKRIHYPLPPKKGGPTPPQDKICWISGTVPKNERKSLSVKEKKNFLLIILQIN